MKQISARRRNWTVIIAVAAAFVLAYPQIQPVLAAPTLLIDAARGLAENVLGLGSIKSLRSGHGGSELLIRWESPTYREANAQAFNRELMYGEAVLTTNAILGQLQQVMRVRFVIVKGDRMLATGESWRAKGVSITFGADLGGGTYTPPPEPKSDRRRPAGRDAQEN